MPFIISLALHANVIYLWDSEGSASFSITYISVNKIHRIISYSILKSTNLVRCVVMLKGDADKKFL